VHIPCHAFGRTCDLTAFFIRGAQVGRAPVKSLT